jgi:RimJ/RimL family protein N-acetyltransferase
MIKLRPMTMADADKMLEWKNYPETRHYALRSNEEINREDHITWLEKNIQYFKVIQGDNEVIGAFRIQDGEVSIWIDKAFRNQGMATKTLNQVTEKGMWCKIVDGNISSIRAFVKAGFVPINHFDNYYILRK